MNNSEVDPKAFKEGKSFHSCHDEMIQIKKEYINKHRRDTLPSNDFSTENQKLLKDYWDKEYGGRDLVDRQTAYNDLQ